MPAAARCAGCARYASAAWQKRERGAIERWVHEAVIERHRARLSRDGDDMMRRRKALAEHPFGTLKCRARYRHFLVRGVALVRGEWSLMALCYNFGRVLRILGFDRWLALLAQRAAWPIITLFAAFLGADHRLGSHPAAVGRASPAPARLRGWASLSRNATAELLFLPSLLRSTRPTPLGAGGAQPRRPIAAARSGRSSRNPVPRSAVGKMPAAAGNGRPRRRSARSSYRYRDSPNCASPRCGRSCRL